MDTTKHPQNEINKEKSTDIASKLQDINDIDDLISMAGPKEQKPQTNNQENTVGLFDSLIDLDFSK